MQTETLHGQFEIWCVNTEILYCTISGNDDKVNCSTWNSSEEIIPSSLRSKSLTPTFLYQINHIRIGSSMFRYIYIYIYKCLLSALYHDVCFFVAQTCRHPFQISQGIPRMMTTTCSIDWRNKPVWEVSPIVQATEIVSLILKEDFKSASVRSSSFQPFWKGRPNQGKSLYSDDSNRACKRSQPEFHNHAERQQE